MADISAIKALDGVTYSIKDSEARNHLVPSSGTTGQVLTKTASGYGWADASGGGTVDTVNGKTGVVVLDADDVGALPDTTTASDLGAYVKPSSGIPKTDLASAVQSSLNKADTALQTAPVTSVNTKTGAVSLTASDLGAYTKPSTGIPKSDLASSVQTSLGKADTALQSAPVTSVNSKTGAVSLSASDVGALPDSTTIPTKTSDLTNDSGYITSVPSEYVTETELNTAIAGKANTADLATVATSGSYEDLTNKPSPEVFLVTISNDSTSSTGYRSDKTYAEVVEALEAGKIVVGTSSNTYFSNLSKANSIQFIYNRRTQTRQFTLPKASTEVTYSSTDTQTKLTFDNEPTADSANPVKSGGVYTALSNKQDALTAGSNVTISGNSISATDTTYSLSMSGNVITLTPSSGTASSITLPVYSGGVSA